MYKNAFSRKENRVKIRRWEGRVRWVRGGGEGRARIRENNTVSGHSSWVLNHTSRKVAWVYIHFSYCYACVRVVFLFCVFSFKFHLTLMHVSRKYFRRGAELGPTVAFYYIAPRLNLFVWHIYFTLNTFLSFSLSLSPCLSCSMVGKRGVGTWFCFISLYSPYPSGDTRALAFDGVFFFLFFSLALSFFLRADDRCMFVNSYVRSSLCR